MVILCVLFLQILNPLDSKCDHPRTDAICVSNMHSAIRVDKGIFTKKPDAKFYLPFKFYYYDLQNLFAPNHFYKFMGEVYSTNSYLKTFTLLH